MYNKRGQVTLFIILGIIVLIIVGIAIFVINLKKEKVDTKVFEENYDARLAPIKNDVTFCISTLGKEAITKIGETGGYVNLNPANYKYNMPLAYDNNALELFPNSKIIIPYWLYISDAPDCKECNQVQAFPSLTGDSNSVQNSIQTYVENNLIGCLNNFSAYKYDLDISYNSSPVCSVDIRDTEVFIGVDWKLDVKFPDETVSSSLSKYSATLDVKLKSMYEYALNILYQTEMIEDERAFENFMKDILSFYSFGGENAAIPPLSGPTIFEFKAPTIWLQSNVEAKLKDAVAENIPYMQVAGTKDSFIMVTNDSIKSNFYANFQNVVYYDDQFASQVRVRFNYYPIWPFYVSVSPSDGPVIMPESSTINMWIVKLSTTKYNFYYNVAYPVLVTLEDDSAFGGEGFTFNYAFEVNLRDNEAYSNGTIDMKSYMNTTQAVEDLGYSQRTVPVKINVINGYTNLPVEGVTLSYTCVDKEYIVGTSGSTPTNPNTVIDSYLAPCIGGKFSVDNFEYAESPVYGDAVLGEPIAMDFKVYPARSINLDLRKRLYAPTVSYPPDYSGEIDRKWALSSNQAYTSSLDKDEDVMFMMTEIRSDGSTGNVVYLKSSDTDKNFSITPGKYSVQVISTIKLGENYSRMNITIPGRTMKVGGKDVVMNDTVIEKTMYMGGITLNEDNLGLVTITPDDLMTKSYFVVYYPSYSPDDLKYIEDLSVLEKVMSAGKDYPALFIPSFE